MMLWLKANWTFYIKDILKENVDSKWRGFNKREKIKAGFMLDTASCLSRGYLPWIGSQGCASGKTLFTHFLNCSTRPPFWHFSVPQDLYFNKKSQNFPIFCLKCLELVNFQFLSPKIEQIQSSKPHLGQQSVLKAAFLSKNSVQQAP